MAIINAKADDNLVKEFLRVIYERHGVKKGDFKNALEEAMLNYIRNYSAEKVNGSHKESIAPVQQ